jgi:hypothetical protein
MADFFKTAILGLIACILFFNVFGRPQSLAEYIEGQEQVASDPVKQDFMEDCLSVTMNTKFYCERTFKELTEVR